MQQTQQQVDKHVSSRADRQGREPWH